MSFTVLYVCTGNVCRSPMAQLLFRHWVGEHSNVVVSSAGTAALVGQGIDHSSGVALAGLGIDPSRHRARQFEAWMAADADLILTAERGHRDLVMTEVPRGFRRTFTMKEFARIARHARPGRPRDVVADLADLRGIDGAVPEEADNMPDPYGGHLSEAASIAQQVTDTVHATIGALGMWPPEHPLAPPVVDVPVPARPRPRPRPRRG